MPGSGAQQIATNDTAIVPQGTDDVLNPPRVPIDRALLDLIGRGDLWLMFSDALLARDLRDRLVDFRAGLDAHVGGGLAFDGGPSLAELRRRRREYRGIEGRPARAKGPREIRNTAAASWFSPVERRRAG